MADGAAVGGGFEPAFLPACNIMANGTFAENRRRTSYPVAARSSSSDRAETIHPPAMEPSALRADRVASSPPAREITAHGPIVEVEAAFERRDFDEAIRLADAILRLDPDDVEVARIAKSARIRLRHAFIATYGSTARTPRLVASIEEITRRRIDATTGFVLALIGSVTVEEILDIVPKPQHETFAILRRLVDAGLIDMGGSLASGVLGR